MDLQQYRKEKTKDKQNCSSTKAKRQEENGVVEVQQLEFN